MEIWKKIDSPYNNYEISNYGRLKNRKTNYLFTLTPDESNYIHVSLSSHNKSKCFLIHRLVAKYFLESFDEKLCINHIDGNPLNNNVSNLECVSIKENNNKKVFPSYGQKHRIVNQYDKNNNLIKRWNRIKDIPNVSKGIFKAIKNKKLYKGYYWEYHEDVINNEIWKSTYFNNQEIHLSNLGRVKLTSGKISYGRKLTSGYYDFQVGNKSIKIHRLICMAFKPIKNYEKLVVNHIDGNKGNNKIENLEWVTQSQNTIQSYKFFKRIGIGRKVIRIDKNNNETEYNSLEIASKMNNIKNKGNIVMVCQKKRKTAGGFNWKYKN